MSIELSRCVNVLNGVFSEEKPENIFSDNARSSNVNFWQSIIKSSSDPRNDTTLWSSIESLLTKKPLKTNFLSWISCHSSLQPIGTVYGAVANLLCLMDIVSKEPTQRGQSSTDEQHKILEAGMNIVAEYLTISKWSCIIGLELRSDLYKRLQILGDRLNIKIPAIDGIVIPLHMPLVIFDAELTAPAPVSPEIFQSSHQNNYNLGSISEHDLALSPLVATNDYSTYNSAYQKKSNDINSLSTDKYQEVVEHVYKQSNNRDDNLLHHTELASSLPFETNLPTVENETSLSAKCVLSTSSKSDDLLGADYDVTAVNETEIELFGSSPFLDRNEICFSNRKATQEIDEKSYKINNKVQKSLRIRFSELMSLGKKPSDVPASSHYKIYNQDGPRSAEARQETEYALHASVETMLLSAYKYGSILQRDKEVLAGATVAVVEYLSRTSGAMAAIKVFSWGNKLGFFQEMLMLIAAILMLAFMFFFIFATILVA